MLRAMAMDWRVHTSRELEVHAKREHHGRGAVKATITFRFENVEEKPRVISVGACRTFAWFKSISHATNFRCDTANLVCQNWCTLPICHLRKPFCLPDNTRYRKWGKRTSPQWLFRSLLLNVDGTGQDRTHRRPQHASFKSPRHNFRFRHHRTSWLWYKYWYFGELEVICSYLKVLTRQRKETIHLLKYDHFQGTPHIN